MTIGSDDPQHQPDPEQQARDAWEKLPQGTPSREALPPAGGGLGAFFGLFVGLWNGIKQLIPGKREQAHHSEEHKQGEG